jgi:hypothetical protein
MAKNFSTIVAISADTVAELRGCDVYRVVDAANDMGCMAAFAKWLMAKRADLTAKVLEAMVDVTDTTQTEG